MDSLMVKTTYPFVKTFQQFEEERSKFYIDNNDGLKLVEKIVIQNAVLTSAKLGCLQQYTNRLGMEVYGSDFCLVSLSRPVAPYIGALLQFFADFFESKKDFFEPKDLEGQYLRLVLVNSEIVGFGHIIKDQFVFLDDVVGEHSKLWKK